MGAPHHRRPLETTLAHPTPDTQGGPSRLSRRPRRVCVWAPRAETTARAHAAPRATHGAREGHEGEVDSGAAEDRLGERVRRSVPEARHRILAAARKAAAVEARTSFGPPPRVSGASPLQGASPRCHVTGRMSGAGALRDLGRQPERSRRCEGDDAIGAIPAQERRRSLSRGPRAVLCAELGGAQALGVFGMGFAGAGSEPKVVKVGASSAQAAGPHSEGSPLWTSGRPAAT